MFKGIKYIYLLSLLLIPIGLCIFLQKDVENYNNINNVIFCDDSVPADYSAKGYHSWAETEDAIYYFSYGTDEEKLQLICNTEIILHRSIGQYNMQPMVASSKIIVCFRKDSVKYKGNGKAVGVEINPQDRNQIGMLTYFISGGQLPVWLCVGLEQYWLDKDGDVHLGINKEIDAIAWYHNAVLNELPALGDEWFIPGMIKDKLSEEVWSISYAFVKYLDQNNQLSKLLEAYMEPQRQQAGEQLKNHMWSKFTKTDAIEDSKFVFRYLINQYLYTIYNEELKFYIQGARGKYYYSAEDWWTLERAIEYAQIGESSIKYVEDWFEYDGNQFYDIYYIANTGTKRTSGQTYNGSAGICVYVGEQYIYEGCAHEVVHAVLDRLNIRTKGIDNYYSNSSQMAVYLEEGLCSSIAYLFTMETDNLNIITNSYKSALSLLKKFWGDEYLLQYLLTVIAKGNDANKIDAITFADMVAIKKIEENNLESEVSTIGDNIYYLLDPDTCTSFVLYLFKEQGNTEEFMKIYSDLNLIEDVYGKNLGDMIDEWIVYLNYYYGAKK